MAADSMKQAARRPSPPFPRPASGSCSNISSEAQFLVLEDLVGEGIKQKIRDIVCQRAADEKLHREIVEPLRVLLFVGLLGQKPSLRQNVAHGPGQRLEPVAGCRRRGIDAVVKEQVPFIQCFVRSGELHGTASVLLFEKPVGDPAVTVIVLVALVAIFLSSDDPAVDVYGIAALNRINWRDSQNLRHAEKAMPLNQLVDDVKEDCGERETCEKPFPLATRRQPRGSGHG